MKFTSGCKDRKEMDKLFMIETNTPRLGQAGHGVLRTRYASTLKDHEVSNETSLLKLNKGDKNYGY